MSLSYDSCLTHRSNMNVKLVMVFSIKANWAARGSDFWSFELPTMSLTCNWLDIFVDHFSRCSNYNVNQIMILIFLVSYRFMKKQETVQGIDPYRVLDWQSLHSGHPQICWYQGRVIGLEERICIAWFAPYLMQVQLFLLRLWERNCKTTQIDLEAKTWHESLLSGA